MGGKGLVVRAAQIHLYAKTWNLKKSSHTVTAIHAVTQTEI